MRSITRSKYPARARRYDRRYRPGEPVHPRDPQRPGFCADGRAAAQSLAIVRSIQCRRCLELERLESVLPDQNAIIDEAILSVVERRWRKVAMIVAHAEDILDEQRWGVEHGATPDDGDRDNRGEAIAERVRWLVETGRLEGVGNLSRWRHSEVRLPPDAQ